MSAAITVGRRTVPISHPDRVVFPAAGLTKMDLARHYATVADVMVPHVRGRPLALQSFPQGIDGEGYFAKNAPRHFPGWITTVEVPKREGGTVRHVVADDAATLVYLAGQNVVTPHVWTSRADMLERPDRLIFDLDPTIDDFDQVRRAALRLGALLRGIGMTPFAMTTGSRGLHVVTPLRRTAAFPAVQEFAARVAAALVAEDAETLTTAFHVAERGDRIYVDINRTRYAQHAVAPYAVRPLPEAPVATPLRWDELDDPALSPRGWTIATIAGRLAAAGDPWRDIAAHARAIGPAGRALGA